MTLALQHKDNTHATLTSYLPRAPLIAWLSSLQKTITTMTYLVCRFWSCEEVDDESPFSIRRFC
jgi:hypothetical protein